MRVTSRAGDLLAYQNTSDRQRIPWQMRDAVEVWARQWGRHATMGWNSAMRCAVIELTLKDDDPRMKDYKEGRLKFEPKETIPLNYQPGPGKPYQPINLEELGVSGLIEMLDRANTWSGRGEYRDMHEAVQAVEIHNQTLRDEVRKAAVENARLRARDERRWVFGEPTVSVPDTITKD